MFGQQEFWSNGPKPGSFYDFPAKSIQANHGAITRTQSPITTSTSVLGICFDGGVMIAADTLGSYGSLAKFKNCQRLVKINENTIIGAGGDYADFQFLQDIIEQKVIDEDCLNDGFHIKPKSLYCWLTRVLYNRRSKFDPLWTTFVVGGLQDGKTFLGHIDKIGTAFTSPHIATGYGAYIALPLMRDAYEKNPRMSQEEAKNLLIRCLRVLFYRDARAYQKFQIATVTKEGSAIEGPLELDTNWDVGLLIKPGSE